MLHGGVLIGIFIGVLIGGAIGEGAENSPNSFLAATR